MDLLDTRQLRAFVELARRESFTEAASHLFLTQSAVSHSIKALEGSLDVALFERLGKRVRLTKGGEALLPHADAILARMEHAVGEVVKSSQSGRGRLRIGASPSISQYILPTILREVLETFPNYEISIATGEFASLLQMLEDGEIDTVLAIEMPAGSKLTFTPLFTDIVDMAISPMHPLANQEEITAADLANEKFIVGSRDSETFQMVRSRLWATSTPPATLQVGSMAAIKEMAKIGLGVGLLASWVAQEELRVGSLTLRPLPGGSPKRCWGVYRATRSEEGMMDFVFTEMCRNVFANLEVRSKLIS